MQFALIKSIIGLIVVICYFFLFTFILLFISYHYHHHHHYSKSEGKRNVKKLWTFSNSTTFKKWRQAFSLFLLSSYSSPMFQFGPHGKDFAISLLAYLSLVLLLFLLLFLAAFRKAVNDGETQSMDLSLSILIFWQYTNVSFDLSSHSPFSFASAVCSRAQNTFQTHYIFLLQFTTNSSHNKEIN